MLKCNLVKLFTIPPVWEELIYSNLDGGMSGVAYRYNMFLSNFLPWHYEVEGKQTCITTGHGRGSLENNIVRVNRTHFGPYSKSSSYYIEVAPNEIQEFKAKLDRHTARIEKLLKTDRLMFYMD